MPMLTTALIAGPNGPPRAVAHARREALHLCQDAPHVGHHVVPVDEDRLWALMSQRDVEHSALLGVVQQAA